MSYNRVILVGNLVADPELKKTNSGKSVVSIRIAVGRNYSKTGENNTDFFNATAWEQRAEFICRNFSKGKQILIEGQLQNRSWTDKDGQKRTVTEINISDVSFVGNKSGDSASVSSGSQSPSEDRVDIPSYGSSPDESFSDVSSDDELPF